MKREEQRPHGKKNNMYMQEGIGVRAQRGGVWEWKVGEEGKLTLFEIK